MTTTRFTKKEIFRKVNMSARSVKKEIDHGTKLKGIHILMEALNSGETGNNEGFLMRNFPGPKTE